MGTKTHYSAWRGSLRKRNPGSTGGLAFSDCRNSPSASSKDPFLERSAALGQWAVLTPLGVCPAAQTRPAEFTSCLDRLGLGGHLGIRRLASGLLSATSGPCPPRSRPLSATCRRQGLSRRRRRTFSASGHPNRPATTSAKRFSAASEDMAGATPKFRRSLRIQEQRNLGVPAGCRGLNKSGPATPFRRRSRSLAPTGPRCWT